MSKDIIPLHNSKYLVQTRIGGGGFCEVLKATNLDNFKVVAIKILDTSKPVFVPGKEQLIERKLRQFMQREANIMRSLEHVNILKCYDFYEDDKECFLELELVNGGELFEKISTEHKIEESESAEIITQLLKAIGYMHDKGYVHRDIKPENILFLKTKKECILKLADMGLSRQLAEKMYTNCGTIDYCAPELLMNRIDKRGYGKEVDIWSIGVVVYVTLCGYQPFASIARNEEALKNEILNCNFKFHRTYWSNISSSAKKFISSILKLDPKKRPTIDQLLLHPWIFKRDTLTKDVLEQSPGSSPQDPWNSTFLAALAVQQLLSYKKDRDN